jgi:exodeoxyribonuclease VII large subunit
VVDHGSDPVPTWSVAELHEALNGLLVHVFGDEVWIEGEMRNLNRSAKGHVYFDLVDAGRDGDPTRPMLSVTLFDKERQAVNRHLTEQGGAVRMGDGIRVRIRGRLNIYGARSSLQLRMSWIDPAFTLGVMGQERDRVLAVLAAEGLLGANAAAPMPLVPLHIALVTSINSAAHADALHELQRAGPGFRVTVVDTRTQGSEAERSIVAALGVAADRGADVVLLVRGGGARTDLAAFDSELVARAIVASPLPVVTGIGHEIDRTVADEVAHSAHKTPTAAAAAVADGARRFALDLGTIAAQLPIATRGRIVRAEHALDAASRRAGRSASHQLSAARREVEHLSRRAAGAAPRSMDAAERELGAVAARIAPAARRHAAQADSLLVGLAARARSHDPAVALARGWSVTRGADGRALRSVDQLAPGDRITTTLTDGTVHSTVIGTDDPTPQEHP